MLIFLDSQQFDTRYFRYIYVPHGKATNRTASARSNTATRLHFISLDAPSIIAFTLSAAVPAIAASFSTFTGSVTPTTLRARLIESGKGFASNERDFFRLAVHDEFNFYAVASDSHRLGSGMFGIAVRTVTRYTREHPDELDDNE